MFSLHIVFVLHSELVCTGAEEVGVGRASGRDGEAYSHFMVFEQ